MRTRKFRIVAALITVAALSALAVGCGRHHKRPSPERVERFSTHIVDEVLDDVDATDKQVAAIRALRAKVVKDVLAQRKDHRAAGDALFAEFSKDRPDAAKVHELIDARSKAMTAVAHRTTDALMQAHAVLTPAQRKELLDEVAERRARHRK